MYLKKKRELTLEEKIIIKIQEELRDYEFLSPIFIYPKGYRPLTPEEHKLFSKLLDYELTNNYEELEKIRKQLPKIPERYIDIKKTLNLFPKEIKEKIIDQAKSETIYEDIIELTCPICKSIKIVTPYDINDNNDKIIYYCEKCQKYVQIKSGCKKT